MVVHRPLMVSVPVFRTCPFDAAPEEDDLRHTTVRKQDLVWIGERLKTLIGYALPAPGRAKGRWIEQLHRIWGETWIPSLNLGNRARVAKAELAKLNTSSAPLIC